MSDISTRDAARDSANARDAVRDSARDSAMSVAAISSERPESDDNVWTRRLVLFLRVMALLSILKGSERQVADTAIDRPKGSTTAPVKMPVGTFGSGGGLFSGPSFFDRLFGAADPAPKPKARVNNDRRAQR